MLSENIVLQSSGSLAIAFLALIMFLLQATFFFKKSQLTWYAWSAAISLSSILYSIGVFIEYNTPSGSLNRFAGILEWVGIICLIHCVYGFTFSYLKIKTKFYHPVAGTAHLMIIILLWFTDYVVADTFVARDFIGLKNPFIEAELGPLGPVYIIYAFLASLGVIALWLKQKGTDPRQRNIYLAGLCFWIILGAHDALAVMGFRCLQYLTEYGFLGFSIAVLWVVFDNVIEVEAEEKYRVITEFANDCILIIQDGKIVFGNPACSNLTGNTLSDLEARDFVDIMVPEDRKKTLKYYERLLNGGDIPEPYLARINQRDDEQGIVEINSTLIQYKNRPAVLAILRDVTQQKRIEAERRENEKKLARLRKMESLGLLAGGVAHDLNNVLSGIVSYPELILMELPEDSKLVKPVKTIQTSGRMAAAIVNDLLTIARGVALTLAPLNLNDVIKEYEKSSEYKKLLRFHPEVTVSTHLDSDLFNIIGSKVHIRKAVMNLVSNAAEAIGSTGNVTISTQNRYIDRPVKNYDDIKKGEYVVLTIKDDGFGMSSSDLEQLFEPFYSKKVMGRSGTGLGLTIVWNVIRDHDGHIGVTSDESGTTFELYFPITRDELPEEKLYVPIENLRGKGESILVVDDVESQREIACSMLEKLGYKAWSVSSGKEAVEYLKEHTVDLVLLDMIMDPGLNGRETYERIIEIQPGQKAVIVSGYAETEEVKKIQNLGAGPYIKKPYLLEQIGMAIKTELDKPKI